MHACMYVVCVRARTRLLDHSWSKDGISLTHTVSRARAHAYYRFHSRIHTHLQHYSRSKVTSQEHCEGAVGEQCSESNVLRSTYLKRSAWPQGKFGECTDAPTRTDHFDIFFARTSTSVCFLCAFAHTHSHYTPTHVYMHTHIYAVIIYSGFWVAPLPGMHQGTHVPIY